jgi:nucleoside-diphosphate-sugar epimerase
MRILVTGATGFFGPEIVSRLRSAGHEVVGASRRSGKEPGTVAMDITDPQSCAKAFAAAGAVDAVVHAAALAHVDPGRIPDGHAARVNTAGTGNVLSAARDAGVRRFVFISSVMVYGDFDLPSPVTETDARKSRGEYGTAKEGAEALCLAAAPAFESMHVLRMATMYSPDWLSNVRKRVRPFTRGKPLYFRLDPHGRRYSLCSRRNGAEAVRWAIEGRLPAGVYNVADQYAYSQQEILRAVESTDGPGWHVPVPVFLPRLMWQFVRLAVPSRRWRDNAHSRYWKFCESNLYSSDKLSRAGFEAPPDLLALGR